MRTRTANQRPRRGLSFRQVWAALMENRDAQQKTDEQMKRTDEQMKRTDAKIQAVADAQQKTDEQIQAVADAQQKTDEQMKRTDAKIQAVADAQQETDEQMKRTDEQMKRTDERLGRLGKNVGGTNRSIGELTELIFAAKLWKKFPAYPYQFVNAVFNQSITNEKGEQLAEVDIVLLDGEYVMAVEIKRKLTMKHIKHHVRRIKLLLQYPFNYTAGKKHLGAVAACAVELGAIEYAHVQGFFVLELTGEAVALVPPPEGFNPRQW
ncbi:hypothetical protein ACYULU_12875 [Breznakiellaceae bacterium SP9]